MLKYHLARLVCRLILFLKVTASFIVMYSSLTAFFIPLVVILPYRLILWLTFSVFYNGKYKLVNSSDSVYAAWSSSENISNVTCFIYVDGPCDVTKLRERIRENVLRRDKNGHRPYESLLKVFLEKFKFLCVSDCSKTIDFNHHIRLCPEVDDSSKIYQENEFLDVAAKLVDQDWPEGKPKWEILIVPKVKCEESDNPRSIVFSKFHHFYVDGVSILQFIRKCIADQPTIPLAFDPVNPPTPRVPLLYKIITALESLILEPYQIIRNFWNTTDRFPCEKAIGGKLYGRTKLNISKDTLRRIRSFHNCSTDAVFHAAFLGSLQKIAKLKGMRIPPQTIAAKVCANFPYPNEFPANLAYFGHQLIKAEFEDPIERLKEMNKFMVSVNRRHYALKSTMILTKILGWYPMAAARYFVQFFKPSYYLSSVAGCPDSFQIQGWDAEMIYGFAPICNGVGYCAVVGIFRGSFHTGFLVNKSALIENREDIDTWILEYDNEIRNLEKASNAN